MKKKYEKVKIETVLLEVDVITASNQSNPPHDDENQLPILPI